MREEVAQDREFKLRVREAMGKWEEIRREGLPIMSWWELIVKPGVKKIAMDRSKEINKDKRGVLNLLQLRQAYLIKKIQNTRL